MTNAPHTKDEPTGFRDRVRLYQEAMQDGIAATKLENIESGAMAMACFELFIRALASRPNSASDLDEILKEAPDMLQHYRRVYDENLTVMEN